MHANGNTGNLVNTGCMACRGGRVYTSCPKGPRAMPNLTHRFIIAARHEVV